MLSVIWPKSASLARRFAGLAAASRKDAPLADRCRADIRRLAIEDHVDKMLRGVNGDGTPRAPLAASTLARQPGRDPRSSLVPHGASSRFVTHFEPFWEWEGGDLGDHGTHATLSMRFVDIVNDRGQSFAQYHLEGCPERHLPRRDVARITPKYWRKIVDRCRQFGSDLIRAAVKG